MEHKVAKVNFLPDMELIKSLESGLIDQTQFERFSCCRAARKLKFFNSSFSGIEYVKFLCAEYRHEDIEFLRPFLEKKGFSFPVLTDRRPPVKFPAQPATIQPKMKTVSQKPRTLMGQFLVNLNIGPLANPYTPKSFFDGRYKKRLIKKVYRPSPLTPITPPKKGLQFTSKTWEPGFGETMKKGPAWGKSFSKSYSNFKTTFSIRVKTDLELRKALWETIKAVKSGKEVIFWLNGAKPQYKNHSDIIKSFIGDFFRGTPEKTIDKSRIADLCGLPGNYYTPQEPPLFVSSKTIEKLIDFGLSEDQAIEEEATSRRKYYDFDMNNFSRLERADEQKAQYTQFDRMIFEDGRSYGTHDYESGYSYGSTLLPQIANPKYDTPWYQTLNGIQDYFDCDAQTTKQWREILPIIGIENAPTMRDSQNLIYWNNIAHELDLVEFVPLEDAMNHQGSSNQDLDTLFSHDGTYFNSRFTDEEKEEAEQEIEDFCGESLPTDDATGEAITYRKCTDEGYGQGLPALINASTANAGLAYVLTARHKSDIKRIKHRAKNCLAFDDRNAFYQTCRTASNSLEQEALELARAEWRAVSKAVSVSEITYLQVRWYNLTRYGINKQEISKQHQDIDFDTTQLVSEHMKQRKEELKAK